MCPDNMWEPRPSRPWPSIKPTASNSTSEGAGVAPRRVEVVGKWANTSSQITQIEVLDTAQGDLGLTSGTIKVWGSN